jgi:aspartate aminotransferase
MLAPGAGFYTEGDLGRQEVRIAYVINKEQIAIAMECIELALMQYPGRIMAETSSSKLSI